MNTRYRLTLPDGDVDAVALRNFAQGGEVALEGSAPLPGEGQPRSRPLADMTLVHLDVAGLLEQAHLLGQHGVGHLNVVANEAELDLARGEQQRDDGEADWMSEQIVQGVTGMAQRRQISQPATSRGMTATTTLTPK